MFQGVKLMQTRAAVVREFNQLAIETIELDPPKAGEVLVKIQAAGVCHSDLHTMRSELRSTPPLVCLCRSVQPTGAADRLGPTHIR